MERTPYQANRQQLLDLMQQADITSLRQLSQLAGVSEWQLHRLMAGLLPKMRIECLLNLSSALQVPLNELIVLFCPNANELNVLETPEKAANPEMLQALETLKNEYQHLQQQLSQQRETLKEEFQRASLAVLESWLLQWPSAVAMAQQKPQLPAIKLLPLVKPIVNLLKQWGVEAIAAVGDIVAYDPQIHQLLEGNEVVEPGDLVVVRYVGYRHGDKLLYRARVSSSPNHETNQPVEKSILS